jgi:hypothetical protein
MKRLHRGNETGASLVIVLIIVTVASAVMGVMLSQVDTSVRTTVVLRDQTSDNYAADAAAQAVVAQVQNGSLPCATPGISNTAFGMGGGASAFYNPVQTQDGPLNAAGTCTPDTVNGKTVTGGTDLASGAIPPALVAYGTSASEGISISGPEICVLNGSVASNSILNASSGLDVGYNDSIADRTCPPAHSITNGITEVSGPAGSNGRCTPASQFTPTPCTQGATVPLPTVPTPTGTINAGNTNPVPVCQKVSGKWYAAFLPGLYTNVDLLNSPCAGNEIYDWFTPGTYFFNFAGQISIAGSLIGGTPTTQSTRAATTAVTGLSASSWTASALATAPLGNLATATRFPGACANPVYTSAYQGVEFVFGSSSTMVLNDEIDICASYVDQNTIPVALYGVSAAQWPTGLPLIGATIPPQSGCVAAVGCSNSGVASLLNSPSPNGHLAFSIEGYAYAPAAAMVLNYKNSDGQGFSWGLVARTFQIGGNGSGQNQTGVLPFVFVPTLQGITYSIRYINVWTCVASATACPQKGPPDVRVKVQTTDTGIKVLSWSHQR